MTPADDPYMTGIQHRIMLSGELAGGAHIFHFQSTVIDQVREIGAIPTAAAIVWRDYSIALLHQFTDHLRGFVGHCVSVNFPVNENYQRDVPGMFVRQETQGG